MATDRARVLDGNLRKFLQEHGGGGGAGAGPPKGWVRRDLDEPVRAGSALTGRKAIELFEAQLTVRQLDRAARWLRRQDRGFYTISSAGHEGDVALGELLRADDPVFLHYRCGGLMVQRTYAAGAAGAAAAARGGTGGGTPIFDLCLSLVASAEDPVSGGRHKVFGGGGGGGGTFTPPQTSTIASHLPKALGTAFALERGRRLDGVRLPISDDAVVACVFGDASLNHSVARGALAAARWVSYQHLPLPILWVCQDNGLGISVRTPDGWVRRTGEALGPEIEYRYVDGLDLVDAYDGVAAAVDAVRLRRRPVFLHMRTVRLLGHAGSDIEQSYRSEEEIRAGEALDPVLATARILIDANVLTPQECLDRYAELHDRVYAAAEEAASRPRLETAEQVLRPLAPESSGAEVARASTPLPFLDDDDLAQPGSTADDDDHGGGDADGNALVGSDTGPAGMEGSGATPRHLSRLLNMALAEAMVRFPEVVMFGEDIARKGGVYGVTQGLEKMFGRRRVFNTLLDETTILGLAQGFGMLGMIPIPEIQYLAYLHNAEDQLRGEACSLQYFSNARYANPMVVRIASFGYQKGFGGHFHNDNSIAVLRDIPGLLIAAPARGDDAVGMFRTCIGAARLDGRVSAFLEPIARYNTRDLHEPGDGKWLAPFPADNITVPVGQGRLWRPGGQDLTIITYANGVYLSLRAAQRLKRDGVGVRVFDLRWLAPLDLDGCVREAAATGRALVVDEGRRSGGVHEALVSHLALKLGGDVRIGRVTGLDTYIPIGPAADLVLPGEDAIVQTALALMDSP